MSATLQDAIANHGLGIHEVILDGSIHRFSPDGKKSLSGWYVGHDNGDYQSGAYGDWKAGFKQNFCSVDKSEFSSEQVKQYAHQMAKVKHLRRIETIKRHKVGKLNALKRWNIALTENVSKHPYLVQKQIKALNVRVDARGNLIVPIYDNNVELCNLQTISVTGSKLFTKNAKIKKCFHPLGFLERQPPVIILCEGYATGVSLYQATDLPIIVCFNAGNLASVSPIIKRKYPHSRLIIAGDEDQFNAINIGRIKASIGANLVGGKVVLPAFKSLSTKPTDFNDLHCLEGLDTVSHQIMEGCCEF